MSGSIPVPAEAARAPESRNPAHLLEDSLSIIAFSLMIVLPVYSMTTRLRRWPDIPVSAVVVQQLTLWIGMLGGALAARSDRLLGISSMTLLP